MRVPEALGRLKTWAERLKMYLGWMQFLMIGYLFLVEQPGEKAFLILAALVVFSFFMVFIDTIYIMPQEQRYTWEKTTAFTEFRDDLMDRLERVERLARGRKG
jgi:hypothetical protein